MPAATKVQTPRLTEGRQRTLRFLMDKVTRGFVIAACSVVFAAPIVSIYRANSPERKGAEAHADNICVMGRGGPKSDSEFDAMMARAELILAATKANPGSDWFVKEGERIAIQRGCTRPVAEVK